MGQLDLVVGGPCNRSWMLVPWFDHVIAACRHADMTPEFVFAVPSWAHDVQEEILSCSSAIGRAAQIISVKEPQRVDARIWNIERYQHMVDLRNKVLGEVRELAPDYFWSLDSDILPAEDALTRALEGAERFQAVGMKCYMTPQGREFPSCSMLLGDNLVHRRDAEEGCFPVDCIMAAKLMAPEAYNVDYEVNRNGEDVGWSKACIRKGLKVGWQTQSVCKHVMSPDLLAVVDSRLGW